jgi:hypothetical protein
MIERPAASRVLRRTRRTRRPTGRTTEDAVSASLAEAPAQSGAASRDGKKRAGNPASKSVSDTNFQAVQGGPKHLSQWGHVHFGEEYVSPFRVTCPPFTCPLFHGPFASFAFLRVSPFAAGGPDGERGGTRPLVRLRGFPGARHVPGTYLAPAVLAPAVSPLRLPPCQLFKREGAKAQRHEAAAARSALSRSGPDRSVNSKNRGTRFAPLRLRAFPQKK